jgi:toxin ParE1/3/4
MQIRGTDAAVHDLTEICDYIQEHSSGETARRIALSIYERVGLLTKFPESGRTGRRPETRELVFSRLPYLAVYHIHDEVVEILRILHSAQWP